MLEKMSRRNRSLLSLSLTSLALTLSVSAFCTSYWCEGTHKVVKPLCLSPVKMKNCGQNNSQPYTTGEALRRNISFEQRRTAHEVSGSASQGCVCVFQRPPPQIPRAPSPT